MLRTLLLPLLLALLPAQGVVAQDPQVPKPAPPPPVRSSSPGALAVLERAIGFQGPEQYAREGAIRDLQVRIQATVWDRSKVPEQKIDLTVRRWLTVEPLRFRTEWKTTGGVQIYGYDGAAPRAAMKYWYAEEDDKKQLVESRFLNLPSYAEDKQRVEDELQETRYLLRLFFLANLKGAEVVFTEKPDEKIEGIRAGYSCDVLHRDNLAAGSTEPPLTLWIDKETSALVRAKAHATRDGDRSLIFDFDYDFTGAVQPRVKGVIFPMKIRVNEQPFRAPRSRPVTLATIEEDDDAISFNSGLDPALFLRPPPPKR